MAVETVIWTALPNGLDGSGRLRLTVHVAPRLRNDDGSATPRKLGEFPAFVHWPDRVNTFKFEVRFQGGPTAKGVRQAKADGARWSLLFPPKTRVGPHVFQDHAKRDVHVFPVKPLLGFFKDTYGAAAAVGTNLPSIDDPLGPLAAFEPLRFIPMRITESPTFHDELARARSALKTDGHVVSEPTIDVSHPVLTSFADAYRFYTRPGNQRPEFPDRHVEPRPKPHDFEFHEMLSSLADHPALLRQLGILIDLVVEVDPAAIPKQGVVQVVPAGDLPENPPMCPGTRYDLESRWFGARPANPGRMAHGMLRLEPDLYDLFQVDVDGAMMQTVNFSTTLARMKDPGRRSEATPSQTGLPALRSAGLALARMRRGDTLLEDLKDRRKKNQAIESRLPVVFDAEDLVRGLRVDIFDEQGPTGPAWFSLHRRVSTHTIKPLDGTPAPEPLTYVDEGYLKATSASTENKEHPTPSDDLYLHETIAGWEGWSLSAARPGKRIVEPREGDKKDGSMARHDPEAGHSFPLVTRVSVENGTLPRLRVGHKYRVRVRTVDLAGNSVPFSERELQFPESHLTSEVQPYLRFEPVVAPAVLRRHLDTEGESLEHLAIRSNLGVSPADYAELAAVKKALKDAGVAHAYAEDSQRHLAPPKTSELMAEQEGRFDTAFGGTAAQMTSALRTALREEGTFLDEHIVDIATGQKTIAQKTISLFPAGTHLPLPKERGLGLPNDAYAFYAKPDLLLPYLPDPLAIGVSLTGFDFTGAEVFHEIATFPGNWPELEPFRLRLSEGPVSASFNGGVFEVQLPKAEVIWARLSSVFPEGRLDDFAIWQWVPKDARTRALAKAAVQGRHWMLTPFRQVIFTHAVQQPLVVPDMTKVTSGRSLGDTFAVFRGSIANHARSTGRLDVYGEWTEDVDLVTDDEPRMRAFGTAVAHRAQAFGFDINRSEDNALVALHQARHEFGDTKYRRIVYHSVATTRFREFLPPPLTEVPDNIQRVESTIGAGETITPGLEHHIPSSARPAAPDILYVLPTFRWERHDEGASRTHVRHGKAVRIWLRRPWFSSGDGEQLGVIVEPGIRLPRPWRLTRELDVSAVNVLQHAPQISLRPAPRREASTAADELAGLAGGAATFELQTGVLEGILLSDVLAPKPGPAEVKKMLRPYVTAWGIDPVWQSARPRLPPMVADFPRHAGFATGLTLDELPTSVVVNVAAHDVHFDRARKLWYCDIEVDLGPTYFPFVRLAVARYQAHSLTGAHLSRVVMTDFIQLAPDRTATVVLSERGPAKVTVRGVSGRNLVEDVPRFGFVDLPVDSPITPPKPNTKMRVALERRIDGVPGDLGWERLGAEVTLQASVEGFDVIWTGAIPVPASALDGVPHRLIITEVETYKRDIVDGDPMISTSPADFVRERVVYADTFEL